MNIIKYLFNKKYRKLYTENIIKSLNNNFNDYERVYYSLQKNDKKPSNVNNLKKTA